MRDLGYQLRRASAAEAATGLLLLAAGLWSALALGALAGAVRVPLPPLLLVPPILLGALALRRGTLTGALGAAGLWTGIVGLAVVAALVLVSSPILALGVPALALAAAFIGRRPAAGVLLIAGIAGAEGTLTAYGVVPPGPTTDLLLGGLWVSTLWRHAFGERRVRVQLLPGMWAVGGYLLLTLFEALAAPSVTAGLYSFRVSLWYALAAFAVALAPWSPQTRRRIAHGLVAVCCLIGAYAVFRWVVGPSGAERSLQASTANNFLDGSLRVAGSFSNTKTLALVCALAIPFCFAFAFGTGSRTWRRVSVAACGLMGLALFATSVRAGEAAAVAGLAVAFALSVFALAYDAGRARAVIAAVVAVVAVTGGILGLTLTGSDDAAKRVTAIFHPGEDASQAARRMKWADAMDEIRHHPLGEGMGIAGRADMTRNPYVNLGKFDVDNGYLKIALEQGMIVMGLFAAAMLALVAGLGRAGLELPDRGRASLAIGAAGTLAALMVMMYEGVYQEGLGVVLGWLIAGTGMAAAIQRGPAGESAPARQAAGSPA